MGMLPAYPKVRRTHYLARLRGGVADGMVGGRRWQFEERVGEG